MGFLLGQLEPASHLAPPRLLADRPFFVGRSPLLCCHVAPPVVISTLGRNLAVPATLGQVFYPHKEISPSTRNDRMGLLLGQLE